MNPLHVDPNVVSLFCEELVQVLSSDTAIFARIRDKHGAFFALKPGSRRHEPIILPNCEDMDRKNRATFSYAALSAREAESSMEPATRFGLLPLL